MKFLAKFMENINFVSVTLTKSIIGRIESHRACVRGLGLKKLHQTVQLQNTPSVQGMIKKVCYMLHIEF